MKRLLAYSTGRTQLWTLFISLLWALLTVLPAHSMPLFEADALIERGPRGTYRAIIVKLTPVRGDRGRLFDSLVVSCPAQESRYWHTTIRVGDTLTFAWTTQGGLGRLALLERGWMRECKCRRNPSRISAALEVQFLDARGSVLGSSLESRGATPLVRALTLGLRSAPKPPKRVRIRCGWVGGPARPLTLSIHDGRGMS